MVLKKVSPEEVSGLSLDPIDDATIKICQGIIDDVEKEGEAAFRRHAERLGDLKAGEEFIIEKSKLKDAFDTLSKEQQGLLERSAARVKGFAQAQRDSVKEFEYPVPGGKAGQAVAAVKSAGCYAPGGRYPLPSSVIMTALTARVAGVEHVWVASPRPQQITLAAAYISGADGLIACGGAHTIGAFAYGLGDKVPQCDVIVGPGSKWVTASKKIVSGRVGIDMLAGPSECLVLADHTAEPDVIAADLLAQAEHDTDALPILVTTDATLGDKVNQELEAQLKTLTTAKVASVSAAKGFYVTCSSMEEALKVTDKIGPEHLEVITEDSVATAKKCTSYGGLFIGKRSAEVMGDYCVGPNHTLPTSGSARYTGGLSVFSFLRIRTWLRLDEEDSEEQTNLVKDTVEFARIEGLEGHARSAEKRLPSNKRQKV